MSGLAEILKQQGFEVSGSDKQRSELTRHLESLGIKVFYEHKAEHVEADLVVYTSAVHDDNPELTEALRRGIPCVKRAEMLGELLRRKKVIAVSGTHGKTTATAMISTLLDAAGLNPTLFVGGIVHRFGTNARYTDGDWAVVEADEFDRSFLHLHPQVAVINNLEADHLDCYAGLEDIEDAFVHFANQTSVFGSVHVNADDVHIRSMQPGIRRRVRSFGFVEHADLRATDVVQTERHLTFKVLQVERELGTVDLPLSGRHNVKNALAALSVGMELDVPFPTLVSALAEFRGTGRRFEVLGSVGDVMVVDDYAHHPTEIRATLNGAREGWPGRRIVAVFQPHLYSRTRDFFEPFAQAFYDADVVVLTEIYSAREQPLPGITGEALFERIKTEHGHVVFVPELNMLPARLNALVRPGDLLITLGAGDITTVGRMLIHQWSSGMQ